MPVREATVLGLLGRLGNPADATPDATLLDRFASNGDETAFAALVSRHGPMVLGVCRRTLGDAHAAEDAFQATFLVLAKKARSLTRPEELAAWLHGVARRVALKARSVPAIGRVQQLPWGEAAPADRGRDPLAELTGRELLAILEDEIEKLPTAYRLAVTLCCLEGLTQEEAARRLNATVGVLRGRLERGRARLHARLKGWGMVPAAVLAAGGFARVSTAAAVPARVAGMTARTALRFLTHDTAAAGLVPVKPCLLAEKVLHTMFLNKLKVLAACLLVAACVAAGTGLVIQRPVAAEPSEPNQQQANGPAPEAPANAKAKPKDADLIQGTWTVVKAEITGTAEAEEASEKQVWSISANQVTIKYPSSVRLMRYWLDDKQKPKAITLIPLPMALEGLALDLKGIYEVSGDELRICWNRDSPGERPGSFERKPREPRAFFILKRAPAPRARKPGTELAALEKKLHGEWESEVPCEGEITIRADGTYERRHYSPGFNTLAGTWVVRWDALPPTLILTCKTSDFARLAGTTEEVKLIQLDNEVLAIKYAGQPRLVPYARVKK